MLVWIKKTVNPSANSCRFMIYMLYLICMKPRKKCNLFGLGLQWCCVIRKNVSACGCCLYFNNGWLAEKYIWQHGITNIISLHFLSYKYQCTKKLVLDKIKYLIMSWFISDCLTKYVGLFNSIGSSVLPCLLWT